MYEQSGTGPQLQTDGFKDLKEITQMLVLSCNARIQQLYISKLSETGELKNDLINFIEDFAGLYLNTAEIMKYKKGDSDIEFNGQTKTVKEWCDLADDWLQLKHYDIDTPIIKIFNNGAEVYKAYQACLVKAELFEVD